MITNRSTNQYGPTLKQLVSAELSNKRLFVIDAYCGANESSRLKVRFIMEVAWQAHFVKNMFIQPTEAELVDFEPDFVVMNGSKTTNPAWQEQGLNSENFVAFNLTEKSSGYWRYLVWRRDEKRLVLSNELPITSKWHGFYALLCKCR